MEFLSKPSKRLYALMEEHKLTVKELANQTGIAESTIRSWLCKKSIPKLKSVMKLAEYFRCSLSYLIGLK